MRAYNFQSIAYSKEEKKLIPTLSAKRLTSVTLHFVTNSSANSRIAYSSYDLAQGFASAHLVVHHPRARVQKVGYYALDRGLPQGCRTSTSLAKRDWAPATEFLSKLEELCRVEQSKSERLSGGYFQPRAERAAPLRSAGFASSPEKLSESYDIEKSFKDHQ